MLMYQKSMFDCYYCIRVMFCLVIISQNVHFCLYPEFTRLEVTEVTRRPFDNASFRAYTNFIVTSQNNVCNSACFM